MASFLLRRARSEEDTGVENPWLTLDEPEYAAPLPPPAQFVPPEVTPNRGIAAPPPEQRLATRQVAKDELGVSLWWLAAHGGAGETTLAAIVDDTRAAEHAWPLGGEHGPRDVALVARTSFSGLTAVQHALAHWGSGQLDVNLRALVLLADAPGKLPRSLRDFVQVLQQGAPGPACLIPWQPSWRLDEAQPSDVHKHLKPITAPKEGNQ